MGGQYSYIDQAGKTITVKYSAGVDGFRILEGAHIPNGANGQNSAAHDPNYREPAPAARPVQQQQQQQSYQYTQQPQQQYNNYVQPTQAPRANVNPFINPDDPTHSDFRYNTNAASYQPDTQRRLSLTALTAPGPTPSSTLTTPATRPAMWPPPSLPGPCSSNSSQASTTTTTTTTTMSSTITTSPLSSPGQTSSLPANSTSTDLRPASTLTSSLRFVRVWLLCYLYSHLCYIPFHILFECYK